MALGGALGVLGFKIPLVKTRIAASALVLGLMVVFALRPKIAIAAVIVVAFEIFHGHGIELPEAASLLAYSIGFVISTGLLHLAGIGFGLLHAGPKEFLLSRPVVVRLLWLE